MATTQRYSFNGLRQCLVSMPATQSGAETRDLHHRSHQAAPEGTNGPAQVLRVGALLSIVVLAEGDSLITNKGPPRLCWPFAGWRQVARYGGLGDGEPEHEQLP
jgi:hypothetical protein